MKFSTKHQAINICIYKCYLRISALFQAAKKITLAVVIMWIFSKHIWAEEVVGRLAKILMMFSIVQESNL